jgi:dihydrofolate reductase
VESKPTVSIVAGLAHHRVIGLNGKVPWDIKADREHWRGLVRGHAVIMGGATYAVQGSLADSFNVVVQSEDTEVPGGAVAHSIDEALRLAGEHESKEIFVEGGASIFEQTIGLADKLYLTYVDAELEGDRYFPEYEDQFTEISREDHADNQPPYSFVVLERKP